MRNVLMAVLVAATIATSQIPTNGLMARYDFTNGSLADGSGNRRDIISDGSYTALAIDRFKQPNNAYLFEGEMSGYFYRQDNTFPTGNTDRSVCFWIALAEKGDSVQQVVAWGVPKSYRDTSNGFRVMFRSDTLCVQQKGARYAKAKINYRDFPALGLSRIDSIPWVHIALTIRNSIATWYINGSFFKEVAFPELSTTTFTGGYFVVGSIGTRYIKGKLDEILVYNRALTFDEVETIYRPAVGVTTPLTIARTRSTPTAVAHARNFLLNGRTIICENQAINATSITLVR